MLILIFVIIAVICSTIAVIFRLMQLYFLQHNKSKSKSKKYTKISIFFRLISLVFLSLSIFLEYNNLYFDSKSHITKFLTLINLIILLVPVTIIELIISI